MTKLPSSSCNIHQWKWLHKCYELLPANFVFYKLRVILLVSVKSIHREEGN